MVEERQPHMRGGAHEPLSGADIEQKFLLNARHGGWSETQAQAALTRVRTLFQGPLDLNAFGG